MSEGRHQVRRRFGQNFLIDVGVIERLVRAIAPSLEQNLVEIGPGQGALTEHLIGRSATLQLIEIDRDLVAWLQQRFPQVTVHSADALKVQYDALFDPPRPLRVVGNLPYNISTPLLFHLLKFARWIEDAHFMLQHEVVTRLAASPGDKDWGRLGVMMQYRCQVEPLFGVPPEAFRPRPQVQSRIVRLRPHAELPHTAADETLLAQIVRAAFSQRRKTLRNALKSVPGATEVLDARVLDIDGKRRPETLGVGEFVALANALAAAGNTSEEA